MIKTILLGTLVSTTTVLGFSLSAEAQLDCSRYSDVGPKAVGACIDYKLRLKGDLQNQVVRDINQNGFVGGDCGRFSDIGPKAVGACINQKLEQRGRVQRSVVREFNSIPVGRDMYRQGSYHAPTNYCDRVIHGQCYRRRY